MADRRRALGFTQESLAEALGVDRGTVARWERGKTAPQPWQRPSLAELLHISAGELTDLLRIDDADGAFASAADPQAPPGLDYSSSLPTTVTTIGVLGRYDMDRRSFLGSTVFSAAAAAAPTRDWLLATLDQALGATGRVSTAEVDAIRRTFDTWNELDVIRGGGHARSQLAAYVTGHVLPLLQANRPDTPQGRALFEAAAEQLYILSRMAYDDGQAGLAQAYLLQALRLAQEAQAPDLGAHILAGLSDQASFAGEAHEAIQVAKAGRQGLNRRPSPACEARLLALQAKAEGAYGDRRAAVHSVAASEAAFDRISRSEEPGWARYIDVAYLSGEYANAFKALGSPVETERFARESIVEADRQGRARRGSFAHAALAHAALAQHDLEQAGCAATSAVRLATAVDSSRSRSAVRDLRVALAPHQDDANVADFFEIAGILIGS